MTTSCLPHNRVHGGSYKRQSQAPVHCSKAVCEQKCVTRRAHDRTMLRRLGEIVARFSFFHFAMHKYFEKKKKGYALTINEHPQRGKQCGTRCRNKKKFTRENSPMYILHRQCVTQKVLTNSHRHRTNNNTKKTCTDTDFCQHASSLIRR